MIDIARLMILGKIVNKTGQNNFLEVIHLCEDGSAEAMNSAVYGFCRNVWSGGDDVFIDGRNHLKKNIVDKDAYKRYTSKIRSKINLNASELSYASGMGSVSWEIQHWVDKIATKYRSNSSYWLSMKDSNMAVLIHPIPNLIIVAMSMTECVRDEEIQRLEEMRKVLEGETL